jgi:hypothetical protein
VQALPALLGPDERVRRLAGGELDRPDAREEAGQVVQESDGGSLALRVVGEYDDRGVGGGVSAEDTCLFGR